MTDIRTRNLLIDEVYCSYIDVASLYNIKYIYFTIAYDNHKYKLIYIKYMRLFIHVYLYIYARKRGRAQTHMHTQMLTHL